MKYNFEFYQNKDCEYFPCHETNKPEEFNCHFCYCPLYILDDKCGGKFTYTARGVKDCSLCLRPHAPKQDEAFYMDVAAIISKIAEKHRT